MDTHQSEGFADAGRGVGRSERGCWRWDKSIRSPMRGDLGSRPAADGSWFGKRISDVL